MDDCRDLFARLRAHTDDLRPVLNAIGNELTESARSRIADEKKSPEGEDWAELDPDYAARKRQYSSGGILEYTGNLLNSMTYNVSATDVRVGSNEVYANRHQQTRPYLGVSEDDANAINQFIRDALGE
ncbi:phage virion morphogenesis protein [uncultured Psychrobacter sp.]|uniref:phage virion morphogenesis protein n=1 Tax=uncultured Psychrobacter sp. TaxID=259303 RepID=UPI00263841CE|nr:phage virion morphogenesis protein [uncultured Psychrobacter sp.]